MTEQARRQYQTTKQCDYGPSQHQAPAKLQRACLTFSILEKPGLRRIEWQRCYRKPHGVSTPSLLLSIDVRGDRKGPIKRKGRQGATWVRGQLLAGAPVNLTPFTLPVPS